MGVAQPRMYKYFLMVNSLQRNLHQGSGSSSCSSLVDTSYSCEWM
jgi:hypothetical protein